MNTQQEALRVLRRTGEVADGAIDLGQAALALASFEKKEVSFVPYRRHLALMVEQVQAEGKTDRLEEQLRRLRRVLVVQNKYQGDEDHSADARSMNLMDVIDRRRGSPMMLGLIYLHVAGAVGWAMTGLDLSGHFLLRLSARDGQAVIDPFRAGQPCQIEDVGGLSFDDDPDFDDLPQEHGTTIDLSSEILRPVGRRELLLKIQHVVKRRLLSQDRLEAAIGVLQSMILFAPRKQDLWKELGYLQAERGHLRAAITALEVVKDLALDPIPAQQTDVVLRELRWRLN